MASLDRGTWWYVTPAAERVAISHGRTVDGEPLAADHTVYTSLPAALELAVGIVHACLEVEPEFTQREMLKLWLRED